MNPTAQASPVPDRLQNIKMCLLSNNSGAYDKHESFESKLKIQFKSKSEGSIFIKGQKKNQEQTKIVSSKYIIDMERHGPQWGWKVCITAESMVYFGLSLFGI